MLLETIASSASKIVISGYESGLYSEYLKGWHKDYKTAVDEAGNKRKEAVWMNYSCRQYYLFDSEKEAEYAAGYANG
jgi:hypothetical protein